MIPLLKSYIFEKIIRLKKIIVSVTNDLAGDQRVHRICLTLKEMGFDVLLTGRRLPSSLPLAERNYPTRRMRLLFRKGPHFYAEYNIRLLLFLLFNRFNLVLANDLDTLPANFLAARIKRTPLVYDSHEFFTEVPELKGRIRIQRIWEWLEKKMVPRVDSAYTVCGSIAVIYSEKYHIPFEVVRNLPLPSVQPFSNLPGDEKPPVIIYQGALNMGRGLEQAIRSMQYLPEAKLILAGGGDLETYLHELVNRMHLSNVEFTGRLPLEKLEPLTRSAHLGISVEEDLGLNYRYALPNKLFDYIRAQIPVVVSNLPEMEKVVTGYDIGMVTDSLDPEILASVFRQALGDEVLRGKWKVNLAKAASELNWEKEKKVVKKIFRRFS